MSESKALVRSDGAEQNGFHARTGHRPFYLDEAEGTLAARFLEVAELRAKATAIVDADDRAATYDELLHRSAAVAAGLGERIGDSVGPIALVQPLSLQGVELILGTLFAGFSYLPIDSTLPDAQVSKLIAASRPAAVVADDATLKRIAAMGLESQTCLIHPAEFSTGEIGASQHVLTESGPGTTAALFATSGSTGEPKLVALSHRAILFDIGRQTNDLYLGPDDRFDLMFSFGFSASLASMFGALLNGGELHLLDLRRQTAGLLDWLEHRRITVSTLTVSAFRAAVSGCGNQLNRCPDMRLLSLCGERLLPNDVEIFRAVFASSCVLQNAMAATETRTYAQYFAHRDGPVEDPVPIGFAVHGKEVLLLDEAGLPLSGVAEGEIAIRSRFLATGYANDPARTAARFSPEPDGLVVYRTGDRARRSADGCLTFIGRDDSQVKVRGHRIELEAVEAAIRRLPHVRECAVLLQEQPPGESGLVAYVSCAETSQAIGEMLRPFLRRELPEYMLPSKFIAMSALPVTPNWKIDRRRLLSLTDAAELWQSDPPRDSIESHLAGWWSRHLGVSGVGIRQDFFDLGGNSLLAARMFGMIRDTYGIAFNLSSILEARTIEKLAALIRNQENPRPRSPVIPLHAEGTKTPLFLIHGMGGNIVGFDRLAQHLPQEQPVYAIESQVLTAGERVLLRIEEIAAYYIREIRAIQREGPFCLLGYSFGGLVAFEMAQQLSLQGEQIALLALVDTLRHPSLSFDSQRQAANSNAIVRKSRRLSEHLRRLAAGPNAGEYLRKKFRARAFRTLYTVCDAGGWKVPRSLRSAIDVNWFAAVNYKPSPYPGRITLFRAVEKVGQALPPANDLGWGPYANGGVEIQPVPGQHETAFNEPDVQVLAREIVARLEGSR